MLQNLYYTSYWIWSLKLWLYFKKQNKTYFYFTGKSLRQIGFEARYYPSAELFDELNVLKVCDYYAVEFLIFFLKLVRSALPTEFLNSLHERKVSNAQTRKYQLNLFSWPNEPCSVSHLSLRCRGAKLINCLLETGLCRAVFSKIIKRETKHATCNKKDQISNIFHISQSYQSHEIAHHVLLLLRGSHFILWRVHSDGAVYNIYLHLFIVVYIYLYSLIVLSYNCSSSEKLN